MRAFASLATLTVAIGAAVPAPAVAQSAKAVLDQMVTKYEQRMAKVANYTIVQEAMGVPVTMYFEKEVVDGKPHFRLKQSSAAGRAMPANADDRNDVDMYAQLPRMVDRAEYKGRETVDGHATHVIAINDLKDIPFGGGVMPQNADFTPRRATLYVDTELSVPRRIIFEGQMRTEGRLADVTGTANMLDYREVDGMFHPFRTAVQVEGLGQAVDPEMRQQFEEMKKQLAEMPESQRQMMEQMMKGRMEQMEKMMGGGPLNVELVVRELRVNKGAPQ